MLYIWKVFIDYVQSYPMSAQIIDGITGFIFIILIIGLLIRQTYSVRKEDK